MEILRVENLSKVYGTKENKVVALDNVSFSVNKGEFVAIVGHSGSGKSTLLHLIGGVDRPTKGKVIIEGNNIYTLNDDNLAIFRRRQVGLIYQFYNLIPILNVEENIVLPLELDGKKVDKNELNELLDTSLSPICTAPIGNITANDNKQKTNLFILGQNIGNY